MVRRLLPVLAGVLCVCAAVWLSGRVLGLPGEGADVDAPVHNEGAGVEITLENGRQVELETFVLYVAAAQMPADYETEALKCQAVIARTYVMRALQENWQLYAADLGVSYLDEADMLTAWGADYAEKRRKWQEATEATTGETLRYEGWYVAPVFHRMSAGATRDGGEDFPYLKRMPTEEDLLAGDCVYAVEMSLSDMVKRLSEGTGSTLRPGEFWTEVQIAARDAAGYVEQVQIKGIMRTGEAVADMLGLPSSCFRWESKGDKIQILCRGQGHGYGLSQWSARVKAEQGWTYREILQYFYSGAEV